MFLDFITKELLPVEFSSDQSLILTDLWTQNTMFTKGKLVSISNIRSCC